MRMMAGVTAMLVMAAGFVVTAQPPPPRPPHVPPPEATLTTPHLEATSSGSVTLDAKGTGTLTVMVTPRPGMHLYAPDAEAYTPFTLTIEVPKGLSAGEITYPTPGLYVFPPTGEASRAYVKPFRVTMPLVASADLRARLKGPRPPVTGVVRVRYQACDDRVCYRPTTGAFVFTLR